MRCTEMRRKNFGNFSEILELFELSNNFELFAAVPNSGQLSDCL